MIDYDAIERALGYRFGDRELLRRALTLSSRDNAFNNESLECLGDALLTFIVAEKFYFDGLSEGDITDKKQAYLSDEAMTPVSERLGLASALERGKGDVGNKKAVPSAYEAVTAAIYLDGGLEAARKFALSTLTPVADPVNYVGAVNEILQSRGRECPEYVKILGGTPQRPAHTVEAELDGQKFCAEGENFAAAKKLVAEKIYIYLTGK